MKRYLPLFFAGFLFLISCNTDLREEIIETHPDGTPKMIRYFKMDGQVKDLVKEIAFYPNHNKYYEGEFENNRKHGKWTVWYQNGNVWSEGYFADGLDDGKRTAYHENGQKHFQGKYKKGKMTGTWKFWDEQGIGVKEVDYK